MAADVDSNLDGTRCNIRVLTATSLNVGHTSWGPVTYDGDIDPTLGSLQREHDGVVVHGSVIHWLVVCGYDKILTYNVHKGSLDFRHDEAPARQVPRKSATPREIARREAAVACH